MITVCLHIMQVILSVKSNLLKSTWYIISNNMLGCFLKLFISIAY